MIDKSVQTVKIVLQLLREEEYDQARQKMQETWQHLLTTDVETRRQKIDEINRWRFFLEMECRKLEMEYQKIRSVCPHIMMSQLEEYLAPLQVMKLQLTTQKRSVARRRE